MGPHHPASETAGQRAQVHDVDGLSIGPKEVLDGLPSSSNEQSDSTKKENVIR